MIPETVAAYLERLSRTEVNERLVHDGSRRYLELDVEDTELRLRLGIETDRLGPEKVVLLWDEANDLPVGGYLVIDNLSMGCPALGGIRLAPDVTPDMISSLARGMTMKNGAADIPFGGGKAGLVASQMLPAPLKRRTVAAFARLIARYKAEFSPGPDVGMDDEDMGIIAMQTGLDTVVSKPGRMGGTEIDECGATAGGILVALETVLSKARTLSQVPPFSTLAEVATRPVSVLVQGFGAVGANAALLLHATHDRFSFRVVGLSDAKGFLFCEGGLDIPSLCHMAKASKTVSNRFYTQVLSAEAPDRTSDIKFSNHRDDLLRESADVLIPAAPVANPIGLDTTSGPSMVLDKIGRWHLIVEGANTYSAIQEKRSERRSIERILYRERGTFIATDYLTNSGGVVFAAHEKLVPTPEALQFPDQIRGDYDACERWLAEHADEFARLAEVRRSLAQAKRDQVIEQNMALLVQGLADDRTSLPCDVSEHIAKSRIEMRRTIDRLMTREYVTVSSVETIQMVASKMKAVASEAALVLSPVGSLVGIITDWDIVLAVANRLDAGCCAREIMTENVLAFHPHKSVIDVMPLARMGGYSVMPVIDDARGVLGVIRLQDLIEI